MHAAAGKGATALKITIDVDCTPEEARAFLGLPDVAPMQEWMLREMQERMQAAAGGMGAEEMLKAWTKGIAGNPFFPDLSARSKGGKE